MPPSERPPVAGPRLDDLETPLPGEPPVHRARGASLALRVVIRAVLVAVQAIVLAPLWAPYLVLVALYGWPPNVPRRAQILRYLGAAWTEEPPAPGLSPGRRAWLTLTVLEKVARIPLWGTAWLLDELLYGRALDAIELRAPLFEISAGRSGSTQLVRYLEDDPTLAGPSLLDSVFPYLWLKRIIRATIGRVVSEETVRHRIEALIPPEFAERHEGDPFRMDTFEAALYLSHLNALSLFYGPSFALAEFAFGRVTPGNRTLWEEDFVHLLDRIGQKRLYDVGPGPDGRHRRLFVKGHFLAAAPALARKHPDARFLTMIRSPEKRLQSAINYIRVNPVDATLGPPYWAWLTETILASEADYGDAEQAFYTADGGPIRCVVRFDEYVRDLPGTMERIYATCMDGPVPAHVPREHPPRRRTHYRVDRSLEQLGVDVAALRARTADYRAWCEG